MLNYDLTFQVSEPKTIIKRDGKVVSFDRDRILTALKKCFSYDDNIPYEDLVQQVINVVSGEQTTVEQIQNIVETVLMASGYHQQAKQYILFRNKRNEIRKNRPVPSSVQQAFSESDQYFPSEVQKFQFYNKYSRWNYDLGRRETWIETVDRSVSFLAELSGNNLEQEVYHDIRDGMLLMKAMPSMRLIATAGDAARRQNLSIYNCSYMAVDSIDSFVEALIISMAGCGVGFSVEKDYVEKLPRIMRQHGVKPIHHTIEDTSEGWADALRIALHTWFGGNDIVFNYSEIRPAGAILKIKGGQASGPEPLKTMLNFVRDRILKKQGGVLSTLDAHDIMCAVGNAAVSGGYRRTAMISLFDFDDEIMRHCKDGDFERMNSQRWNANNSSVWPERDLNQQEIAEHFLAMVKGQRGEPGIFSRKSALLTLPDRRKPARFGTNPCVIGDTWVAVADGRGRAKMIDLVNDGKDVPVFTVVDGKLVSRMMRNPRKTGTNVPVYRVKFSDGTEITTTLNHKFAMKDGSIKTVSDLQPNDSIDSLKVYSYKKAGLPKAMKVSYDQDHKSYRMMQYGQYRKSEHRLIYQNFDNDPIDGIDEHIHHKDFDARNNALFNLERMTSKEHASLHRDRMLGLNNPVHNMNDEWRKNLSIAGSGDKNPNYSGITNEDLEIKIQQYIKSLGYIPSTNEYQKDAKSFGWPVSFSNYRKAYFGSNTVSKILQFIGNNIGITETWQDRNIQEKTDLPYYFYNGESWVTRHCEICGNSYSIPFRIRERSTCSHECGSILASKNTDKEVRRQSIKDSYKAKKELVRQQQVLIYNDLVFELNRHPQKKEWVSRCKDFNISPEISRVTSPFRYWSDLQEAASGENHRVHSVEYIGEQDVYTGTVDESHTYFSIGSEGVDTKGRTEMRYVLSLQCGEIVLRPSQLCNLSIAIARENDTEETLREKVRLATIIGTIQSMATHFPGLRDKWRENCVAERLLGVDITGQMDSPVSRDPEVQNRLKNYAIEINHEYADKLGINQSASVTCVKPSGNSSRLFDCSPGIHARWSEYYIANMRISAHSPIAKMLLDQGIPMSPENGQTIENVTTWVVHFPVKSPEGAITRHDLSAIQQCEYWLSVKKNYTEHNPSVTISYTDSEVLDVAKWIWQNQDYIGGMAFLPKSDALYAQMPYEEIDKETYEKLKENFPKIDFSKLYQYEEKDHTEAAQLLACMAGNCDV